MELTPHPNLDLNFNSSETSRGKYLILDTETTGLIPKQVSESSNPTNLPRVIQIAWLLFDAEGKLINSQNRYLRQEMPIPVESTRIHGIDDASILQKGEKPAHVWNDFIKDLENCDYLVAHNIDFDIPIIESELNRLHIENPFAGKRKVCTMKLGKPICKIPAEDGNGYKYPALDELYFMCFHGGITSLVIEGLHDAWVDAAITSKIFLRLLLSQQITLDDSVEQPFKLPAILSGEDIAKSKFFAKIILPTLLTILLFFLTIFFIIIPRFKENIMIGKRQMIKELTNSASSILEKYETDERNGLIRREVAQQTAISRIQYLRYGDENKDYFWITDTKPNMIMHPYRSDLNGKSLVDFSDPHGKKLFVDMVEVTRNRGNGFVEYMWQWKDDSVHIVPKLSYVKAFKPWGWIIGTGIYIEDVKKEIDSLTQKLLIISLGISSIIALLLTYISLQSMKIEKKRKSAESLLRVSREKYKTLVDATTEGLIMVLDNKMIFFNNKISELTGYTESELISQSFSAVISNANNPGTLRVFQGRDLPDGQYELILAAKSGGTIDTIVTISSILFAEKKGKLITIKDASVQKAPDGTTDDILQLLEFAGLGFIRVLLDEKGKIIYSSRTIVKMLGFSDTKELTMFSLLDFFIIPAEKKKYRQQLLAEGKINHAVIHLRRKDGAICIVSASMVVLKKEGRHLQCDGIISDITSRVEQQNEEEILKSWLQSHTMILQNPVAQYIVPVAEVQLDMPVSRVIEMMRKKGDRAILVKSPEGMKIGIITASDIADRIVINGLNIQTPAFEIMSSPLVSIDYDATLNEAIQRMQNTGVSHLVAKNSLGSITGILNVSDLIQPLQNSFSFIGYKIECANGVGELTSLYRMFLNYLVLMIKQSVQPVIIGKSIAAVSDQITRRLITLVIDEMGEPPVEFTFVALGSEGRMEQTLATDQDNAIIYRDAPGLDAVYVQSWFIKLGETVCEHLNTIGFRFCKGRVMANNPLWCKSLDNWKNYFTHWISTPEPRNLLEVSIFFDFRAIYGNSGLTDELRQHINMVSEGQASFFYNFAENVLSFKPSLGLTGTIHTEKKDDRELFDLKYGITPYVMFARIYSVFYKIIPTNTTGRIRALFEAQGIPLSTYKEILFGYNFLMQLRYQHQIKQFENHEVVNNLIDLQELLEAEEATLKKVLSQITDLQSRLNIDFKRSIL
jgi:PAS domain S-box-containing protein